MSTVEDIIARQNTYREQMRSVRETVLRFAEARGWSPMSRGRKAHVSICGPVNGLSGVVDIEMECEGWAEMPAQLQPDTPFTLWCSASLDRGGIRFFADTELYWRATFAALPETVERFLPQAWGMLTQLGAGNLRKEWPGPSMHPDGAPDFGPPRRSGSEK